MKDSIIKIDINGLQEKLGYRFRNHDLLEEALSHPSLKQLKPNVKHHERLELLGDSVLGFLVTEMIFNKFSKLDEGSLAKIKAHAVSKDMIVQVASSINLASYIIMTSGEERGGGRNNPNNVENTLEALIAATYLDSNIDVTREVVHRLWSEHIENYDQSSTDPKTYLQELLQSNGHKFPEYEVISREGESHAPTFIVKVSSSVGSARASGKNKKEAEKEAAKKLIDIIENNE